MTPKEFLDHTKARAGYILDAIHDGKIIYDKGGFMKRNIEEAKKKLKERRAKRIRMLNMTNKKGWRHY